jgi:hypothetical protein
MWLGQRFPALSQAEIERFVAAAEALHLNIIKPFLSPHCEHYGQMRVLHEVLLQGRAGSHRQGNWIHPVEWNRAVQAAGEAFKLIRPPPPRVLHGFGDHLKCGKLNAAFAHSFPVLTIRKRRSRSAT